MTTASSSPSTSSKRNVASSESPSVTGKKQRVAVETTGITSLICKLVINENWMFGKTPDQVVLNAHDFEQLKFNLVGKTTQPYLLIANKLYKVSSSELLPANTISVNSLQFKEMTSGVIKDGGSNKVCVDVPALPPPAFSNLRSVTMNLKPYDKIFKKDNSYKYQLVNDLDATFKPLLKNRYLMQGQKFIVKLSNGLFVKASPKYPTYFKYMDGGNHIKLARNRFFYVQDCTRIDYTSSGFPKMQIVRQIETEPELTQLFFSVRASNDEEEFAESNDNEGDAQITIRKSLFQSPDSLPLPLSMLKKKVSEMLSTYLIYPGFSKCACINSTQHIHLTCERIFVRKPSTLPYTKRSENYLLGVFYDEKIPLTFKPDSTIQLLKDTPKSVRNISFNVSKVITFYNPNPLQPYRSWINVAEFKNNIENLAIPFTQGHVFQVSLSTGEFLVEAISARNAKHQFDLNGDTFEDTDDTDTFIELEDSDDMCETPTPSCSSSEAPERLPYGKSAWEINDSTKINLFTDTYSELDDSDDVYDTRTPSCSSSEPPERLPYVKSAWQINDSTKIKLFTDIPAVLELIRKEKPIALGEITFKISKCKLSSEFVQVFQEDIEKAVHKVCKGSILPNQSFYIVCQGTKFMVTAERLIPAKQPSKSIYKRFGVLDAGTKISFESAQEQQIQILSRSEYLMIADPSKLAADLGLGGISKQANEMIRRAFLPRGVFADEAKRRNITPLKGILMYGPPGTGKSTLAKQLGKLFGCTTSNGRLRMITASEVFEKWVGNSEKNVRDLFEPARADLRKFGKEKAPLHVIVIDELDGAFSKRGDRGNSVRNTVVNQFLGELEGLNSPDNILVIGITNRKEDLDPAVIRKGRLGLHLEFGLPDLAGRKEIFDIHTRHLKKEKLLHEDVDLEILTGKTANFSGADIKDLCEEASGLSLDRLSKANASLSKAAKDALGLVTMGDFLVLLDEKKVKTDMEKYILDTMFL